MSAVKQKVTKNVPLSSAAPAASTARLIYPGARALFMRVPTDSSWSSLKMKSLSSCLCYTNRK